MKADRFKEYQLCGMRVRMLSDFAEVCKGEVYAVRDVDSGWPFTGAHYRRLTIRMTGGEAYLHPITEGITWALIP